MEKKLDSNYTRILQAVLNKFWEQHPTKQQVYGHLPLIMKSIQVRRNRHVGHCWRSKGELISDILLWTLSHGWAKAGQPARTYIKLLCTNTGYSLEDLLWVMDIRDGWRYRVRVIHAGSTTWWWWSWIICTLPMVWETGVQSQFESFQRLKKWYLMLPCLTLSIIR